MSRLPFYLLVGLLFLVGVAMSLHRHYQLEVPWTPGEQRQVWEVEAQVNFTALGDPALVEMALPSTQEGFRLLTEHTASPGYGLSYLEEQGARRAQWSIREATGPQQLYYTAQVLVAPDSRPPRIETPPVRRDIVWERPYDTAASQVIERAWSRSADPYTFARELFQDFSDERQGENARLLLTQFERTPLLVRLLNQAGVPAREVNGLLLEDGRRRQSLTRWILPIEEALETFADDVAVAHGEMRGTILRLLEIGCDLDPDTNLRQPRAQRRHVLAELGAVHDGLGVRVVEDVVQLVVAVTVVDVDVDIAALEARDHRLDVGRAVAHVVGDLAVRAQALGRQIAGQAVAAPHQLRP